MLQSIPRSRDKDKKPMAHEEELKQAILLIRAGDTKGGGQILHDILMANRDLELAWLWLSACVETDDDKRYCLGEVLRINPNNISARKGIERLGPETAVPPQPGPQITALTEPPAETQPVTQPVENLLRESLQPQETVSLEKDPPAQPPPAPVQPPVSSHRDATRPTPRRTAAGRANSWPILILLGSLLLVIILGAVILITNPNLINSVNVKQPTPSVEYQVEYMITGSAQQSQVSYNNASNQLESLNLNKLPYTKKISMPGQNTPRIMVTVQNLADRGTVACEIKVDGVSKTTNQTSAPHGFVTCSALIK